MSRLIQRLRLCFAAALLTGFIVGFAVRPISQTAFAQRFKPLPPITAPAENMVSLARTPDGLTIEQSQVAFDNGAAAQIVGMAGPDVFRVCVHFNRALICPLATGTDLEARTGYTAVKDELRINGLKVVGQRGPAIPDSDGSPGDTARAVNAILAQMRTDGKIEP